MVVTGGWVLYYRFMKENGAGISLEIGFLNYCFVKYYTCYTSYSTIIWNIIRISSYKMDHLLSTGLPGLKPATGNFLHLISLILHVRPKLLGTVLIDKEGTGALQYIVVKLFKASCIRICL
jgi:hypothetical protein